MTERFSLGGLGALVLASVLVVGGCQSGESSVTVTGRLVENGSPLTVSTEGMPPGTHPLQIVFTSLPAEGKADGESFFCEVNDQTGEFTVRGPGNKGIPPGTYRISVTVAAPPQRQAGGVGVAGTSNPPTMMGLPDQLKGRFSPQTTPLQVEITKPSRLLIDVGSKPTVTVE